MFTGIVTDVGVVADVRRSSRGVRLTIRTSYGGLTVGESVAVDGACLTVTASGKGTFSVEAIATTRGRTRVGDYRAGARVNLERALALGDRLGGHLVSGHVDGVGTVDGRRQTGDTLLLDIAVPADVYALCVEQGSITVDGVSLTINALRNGKRTVQVAIIPHTRRHTTLGAARVGDRVHLESDLIGKYVQRLVPTQRSAPRRRKAR